MQSNEFFGDAAEVISVTKSIKVGLLVIELAVEYKIGPDHFISLIGISKVKQVITIEHR